MQRKTGARGLRTILETVLLDTMYELPSMRNVAKVVIDETVIEGQTKPYVVYRSEDEPRRASGRIITEPALSVPGQSTALPACPCHGSGARR